MSIDITKGICIYHTDGSTEFIPFFSKVICRCPELDESPYILLDLEFEYQNIESIDSLELVKEEAAGKYPMETILVPCCDIEAIEVIEELEE